MTDQKSSKTFVRGSYLYLDQAGAYQQRQNMLEFKQKVVQDKIGISKYQKQLKQKLVEATNKKKQNQGNKLVQKPVLIPIRDTPVEPVPEPVLQNQKCQRAMEQQFDYFQNYVSQKQKQRKFEEEQQRRINQFLLKQKMLKQKQIQNPPVQTTVIVMQKQQQKQPIDKTKKIIKMAIKIKKKAQQH